MNNPELTIRILLIVLGGNLAVWAAILWRMRRQKDSVRGRVERSGESIALAPRTAYYMGWNRRYGIARTMGTLTLTDRRVLFLRPIGAAIDIPLSDVSAVSDTVSVGQLKHRAGEYLTLHFPDGSEAVFSVKDRDRWLAAVRELVASP